MAWVYWISSCYQDFRILILWWGICGGMVIYWFGKWTYPIFIFVREIDWSEHNVPWFLYKFVTCVITLLVICLLCTMKTQSIKCWDEKFSLWIKVFSECTLKTNLFVLFSCSVVAFDQYLCPNSHYSKYWLPLTLFSIKKQT